MQKLKNILAEIFNGTKVTYKDKIFKHRLQMFYRIFLAALLFLAISLLLKYQIDNRTYTEVEVTNTMKKTGSLDSVYEYYNGKMLVYSKDGIAAYGLDGKQIWNQTYEMQDPIVKVEKDYVAVCDYKGSKIYVMDSTGIKSEIDTNLPIQDLSVSEKGVVAAVIEDDAITWIRILSATGDTIVNIKTTMQQSGYPMAMNLSQDNIKLGVSYLKPQSGKINTSVAFYNFGDVGQNELDHLVSGFDFEETIIPFLKYVNENTAVAVADQKLMTFSGKQRPKLNVEKEIEEDVQSVYCNEKYIALIYRNTDTKEKYRIDLYDLEGKKVMSKIFDINFKEIVMNDDNIIIYNDSSVLILNANGTIIYHGDMGGDIQKIIMTESKSKFTVVRSESVDSLTLH